jgi:hypothetical protein
MGCPPFYHGVKVMKFKMVAFDDVSILDDTAFLPLKAAMGNSYKIAGTCDAQVVAMLMHRIRHLEEFIMELPIEGFIGDKCYVKLDGHAVRDAVKEDASGNKADA